ITGESTSNGFVNGHPMIHNRIMPRIESDGTDAMNELVTMSGYDADLGQCYEGDASLDVFAAPREELTALTVDEIIGGYFRQVGVSWNGGTTLAPTPRTNS
ncbi:MAG: acetoacetate decarboxylase family protein, partial [Acidimicrobiales bacterium]